VCADSAAGWHAQLPGVQGEGCRHSGPIPRMQEAIAASRLPELAVSTLGSWRVVDGRCATDALCSTRTSRRAWHAHERLDQLASIISSEFARESSWPVHLRFLPASGPILPLKRVCELVSGWGYDGLEIATWGDHFEVDKALADDGYVRGAAFDPEQVNLDCWAIPRTWSGRRCATTRSMAAQGGSCRRGSGGDGDAEGVGSGAAQEVKTPRARGEIRVKTVTGLPDPRSGTRWHVPAHAG